MKLTLPEKLLLGTLVTVLGVGIGAGVTLKQVPPPEPIMHTSQQDLAVLECIERTNSTVACDTSPYAHEVVQSVLKLQAASKAH